MKKTQNLWLKVIAVMLAIVVVGGAAFFGYGIWQERSLPIYEMGEQPPVGGYAVNTLRHGDSSYISGKFEFCLQPGDDSTGFSWGLRIGKTPDGGMYVYKLSGQEGSDWVFLRGMMTGDSVYRSVRLAPITLSTFNATSLEYTENKGGSPTIRRTQDQEVIREVIESLASGRGVQLAAESQSGPYRLHLLSPQIPGLAYLAYVIIDHQGSVYLSERGQEDTILIPAGERFSQWVRASQ